MSRTLPERRGALAALDFFLVIGCYLGATYFLLGDRATMYLLYENGMSAHVFSAGALLFLFYVQGIYDTRNRRADMELLSRLITAVGSVFVLQAGMFYIQRSLAMPLSMMLTGSGRRRHRPLCHQAGVLPDSFGQLRFGGAPAGGRYSPASPDCREDPDVAGIRLRRGGLPG